MNGHKAGIANRTGVGTCKEEGKQGRREGRVLVPTTSANHAQMRAVWRTCRTTIQHQLVLVGGDFAPSPLPACQASFDGWRGRIEGAFFCGALDERSMPCGMRVLEQITGRQRVSHTNPSVRTSDSDESWMMGSASCSCKTLKSARSDCSQLSRRHNSAFVSLFLKRGETGRENNRLGSGCGKRNGGDVSVRCEVSRVVSCCVTGRELFEQRTRGNPSSKVRRRQAGRHRETRRIASAKSEDVTQPEPEVSRAAKKGSERRIE
ncbi:hypothetical protein EDB87DRAFT_1579032 [Lactarius vividus]|nr:hypothetical protein EDB87DRAFT_1579032 [Lactarius vividus]